MKNLYRFMRHGLLAIMLGLMSAGTAIAQDMVLRIGGEAVDIASLDPHRTVVTQEKGLASLIFGGLVRFAPGSMDPDRIEGDLAESWQASADGLSWTFRLRRGVQFHRGYGEATAEDVVYSLQRAADPQRSAFAPAYAALKEVRALDPYTVRLVLSEPIPSLLGLVANYHGGMIVSRKAAEELRDAFKLQPVGFGPFQFDAHQPQRQVTLKAHAGYYRGAPKIARIVYRFIPSATVRGLAFATGDLDLIVGQRDQPWVSRARGWQPPKDQSPVRVDVFAPGEFRSLMLNRRIKPLDDVRVREAVARAVDLAELVRFVGRDFVRPGRSVVPPGYAGEVDVQPKFPHDPARAKALLAAAGFADGITLKAVVSGTSPQLTVMEVIRKQLQRAGIRLDMQVVDHAVYHARIRKDESAIVFYGAARFPIADTYLSEFYHSRSEIGSPTQVTNFSHCSVADREIDAARVATSSAERLRLWRVAQEKIAADVCAVPLFDLQQVWVRRGALDYGAPLDGALNLMPPITERSTIAR